MIESNTNSNEFRSKDGTVVRIPDDDFNIIPWSVTKNTIPCTTRIRTTTICVNNQGLIGSSGANLDWYRANLTVNLMDCSRNVFSIHHFEQRPRRPLKSSSGDVQDRDGQ
ncbi:hypothetical protein TNCV_1609491 [Trichonephila clavipes]|nr:hypothetical protein TNCV_1609491 [Trichonephila clavipes]